MDERLKGLKKAMKNHTFQNVQFSEQNRQKVHTKMEQLQDVDLTPAILSLLTEQRSGSELAQLLHVKGIKSIVDNEGMIYTILHKEELLGTLESYWSKTGEKYYKLTSKGLKIVQMKEQKKTGFSLKQLFQEVKMNGY